MTLLISCVVASGAFVAGRGPTGARAAASHSPPPQTAKPAAPPTAQPAQRSTQARHARTGQPRAGADARAPGAGTGHRPRRHGDHGHHAGRRHAAGIQVDVIGVHRAQRHETNDSGQLNFPGMQAGNYRLRFSGEERDHLGARSHGAARTGAAVDVALNAAPKPPPPPPAPTPAPVVAAAPKPVTGPTGQAQSLSVLECWRKSSSAAIRVASRCCRAAAPRARRCSRSTIRCRSGCTRTPTSCTTCSAAKARCG